MNWVSWYLIGCFLFPIGVVVAWYVVKILGEVDRTRG
jgi:hypothetical protein